MLARVPRTAKPKFRLGSRYRNSASDMRRAAYGAMDVRVFWNIQRDSVRSKSEENRALFERVTGGRFCLPVLRADSR